MKNFPVKVWLAQGIGEKASVVLARNQAGTVNGVTSMGVFLKLSQQELVFISTEKIPGPLTINIEGGPNFLKTVAPGDQALVSPQSIHFVGPKFSINLQNAPLWRPDPLPELSAETSIRPRLIGLVRAVYATDSHTGLGALLPNFCEYPIKDAPVEIPYHDFLPHIHSIQAKISQGIFTHLEDHVLPFLGRGPGLTPSGDDFVLGVLLSLNRWQRVFLSGDQLRRINQEIVAAAYRVTTTLSANLIASAADGQADPRLIQAVDHLMSGTPQQALVVAGLLTWGNSSGVDALVGMLAVVSGYTVGARGRYIAEV